MVCFAGIVENDIDIFLWEVFTTKPFFDSGALKYVSFIYVSFNLSYFSTLFFHNNHSSIPVPALSVFQIGEVSTPWPAFSIVASNSGHFLSGQDCRATDMFRNRFLPALAEGAAFFKNNTLSLSSSVPRANTGVTTVPVASSSASILNRDVQYDSNAVCDDSVSLIVKRFGHQQVDAQRWLEKTQYALPDMSVDAERMRRALQTLQGVGLVPESYPVKLLWGGSRDCSESKDSSSSSNRAKESSQTAGMGSGSVLCNDAISFRQSLPSGTAEEGNNNNQMADLMRSALML